MNYQPGDKVRMVRLPKLEYDEGFVALPEKYRTKELTVTEHNSVDNIFFKETDFGEHAGCFIPSNAVIHTKTQEEYDRLMESLEEVGYEWLDGGEPTYINYFLNGDRYFGVDKRGVYRTNTRQNHYPVTPFTDIFPEEKTDRVETFAYEYSGPGGAGGGSCDGADGKYYSDDHTLAAYKIEENGKITKIKREDFYVNPKRTMLQKLSNAMERKLNSNTKALYRAGFIRDDLELTEEGKRALIDILAVEYETKLANKAREVIEEEDK